MEAHTIVSERLVHRPLVPADLDDLVALHSDPEISRFVDVLTLDEARQRIQAAEREWRELGYGRAAIIDRESGRFLGRSGLKYIEPFDEIEIAWTLTRDAWGQGYATETAQAWIDWGFARLDAPYFTAMIEPDNERSLAVAERLGMRKLRDDVLLGMDLGIYAVARPST